MNLQCTCTVWICGCLLDHICNLARSCTAQWFCKVLRVMAVLAVGCSVGRVSLVIVPVVGTAEGLHNTAAWMVTTVVALCCHPSLWHT